MKACDSLAVLVTDCVATRDARCSRTPYIDILAMSACVLKLYAWWPIVCTALSAPGCSWTSADHHDGSVKPGLQDAEYDRVGNRTAGCTSHTCSWIRAAAVELSIPLRPSMMGSAGLSQDSASMLGLCKAATKALPQHDPSSLSVDLGP